ncbi:MAG: hypothetical protein ABEH58_06520 [Haloplanus sp.]
MIAHSERLWVGPAKRLDGIEMETIRISNAGTPAGNREYAVCDPGSGRIGTGEEMLTRAHNSNRPTVVTTCERRSTPERTPDRRTERRRRATPFDRSTEEGRAEASAWFGDVIDDSVGLRRRDPPSFVGRPDAGPSVISTATLEEVAF